MRKFTLRTGLLELQYIQAMPGILWQDRFGFSMRFCIGLGPHFCSKAEKLAGVSEHLEVCV